MTDITTIVMTIITLIITVVNTFLVPYLKAKLGAERMDNLTMWVDIAVRAAEMIYKGPGKGEEKKAYVVKFLQDKGFKLDMNAIDAVIEAMVANLKLEQSRG